jgi:Fic family protein
MYIEIRDVKGRKKYYLTHSFRRGDKVKKLRFYLGADLLKAEVEEKRKHAEKVLKERVMDYETILDPFRTVLSSHELGELRTLEPGDDIKILHLDENDWQKFTEGFTYNTNAIEGSTVTQSEVSGILEKDRWPDDRSKYEISETYGVADAIGYIRKTEIHISLDLIKKLHEIVFKNSKPFAGMLRKRGEEVAIVDATGKIIHRGAPAGEIGKLLKELVEWYENNKKKYPPLILAAVVHNQFENIHPFKDGNGRVGRILLNNILIKHGLPPVNIELKNRSEYYNALREYQDNENIRPMIELIIKEYKELKRIFKNR